ncbi:NUDIX domain-containing protein [Streptomyces sp. NPDC047023]|uniref:NUDIX hydrolase n=1 Tax=Streptomyces sp. NPDC047023 TaxID=3155139 RepID=UPI0033FF837C
MPLGPFQIVVVPFRRVGAQIEFAVLCRQDMDVWQAVAGDGKSGESPQQAAVREACEELGLDRTVALCPLPTTASIPARFFADRDSWPTGTYVVPEYSFAADLNDVGIKLSDERTALQWPDCKAASHLLRFDSNRTAVGGLHERRLAADLARRVECRPASRSWGSTPRQTA